MEPGTWNVERPYTSLRDFCQRTGLDRRLIERLIAVGAFDGLADPQLLRSADSPNGVSARTATRSKPARRELLWELPAILEELRAGELSGLAAATEATNGRPALEPPSAIEATNLEYNLLGLSIDRHAMEFYRPHLRERGVRAADELPKLTSGRVIAVAGLVICRQAPPTAGGHVFLTLEDETGLANIIIRPQVYQRDRAVVRAQPALLVEGVLQNQEGAISILAHRFTALGREHLAGTVPSRDFH